MRDMLEALVNAESPSSNVELCAIAGRILFGLFGRTPDEIVVEGGHEHYVWRWPGERPVLWIGHLDTVWPAGTLARWPFRVDGDRATGPGCYDMKAGLVTAATAAKLMRQRGTLRGLTIVVNTDEELGSTTSRALIEREAKGARAALVLEPGARGALKVGRKGVGMYRVEVTGRAAHAGLEPEAGINALVEAAYQALAISALGDSSVGTSVTPTVGNAGTARNVVPAGATIHVDVRTRNVDESERVHRAMTSLSPVLPGAVVSVDGGPNRPPMERASAERLYGVAFEIAKELGFSPPAIEVGGGSDGNFTAAMGIETLDGLGGDGGGAHAEGEWVNLATLPMRAQLVARLTERLLDE